MARLGQTFGADLAPHLWASLHPTTVIVGAAVGGLAFGAARLADLAGAFPLAPVLASIIILFVASRVALNTAFGDGPGAVHTNESTWPEALAALVRTYPLNLIWVLPMALAGSSLKAVGAQLLDGSGPSFFAVLGILGAMVLPPVLLVVGTMAQGVSATIDPGHWRHTLGGKTAGVAILALVPTSVALLLVSLGFLVSTTIGAGNPTVAIFGMLLSGSYALGVAVLMMGRMAGSFLRAIGFVDELVADEEFVDAAAFADTHVEAQSADSYDESDADFPDELPHETEEHHQADTTPSKSVLLDPKPIHEVVEQAQASAAESDSLIDLLRANQRRAETDPEGALEELEELLEHRGQHPLLLVRKALLAQELGHDDAIDVARLATEHAARVGNLSALTEIYEAFHAQRDQLDLTPDHRLQLATHQQSAGRLASATEMYLELLAEMPTNMGVIKGLIQIADLHMKEPGGAERALDIYEHLERECPEHPFVEFVDRGREQAERKLVKVR